MNKAVLGLLPFKKNLILLSGEEVVWAMVGFFVFAIFIILFIRNDKRLAAGQKKEEEQQKQQIQLANTEKQEMIESINTKLGFILFFIIILFLIQVFYIIKAENAKYEIKKEMRKWGR